MLSRTAENLYWMARYVERAETTARLLEVGSRMAMIPSAGGYRNEWDSLLAAAGVAEAFRARHGRAGQREIEQFMFHDMENGSSIAACITRARENGRIVRTALTSPMWDALNTAFAELKGLARTRAELTRLTDWTMRQAALFRGTIDATLLRNDGWDFLNLGFALERADNTARLMDVKYFVLLPRVEFVGSGLDNYQWTTLLRALGAHRAFHWAYGGEVTAAKIAHFLILNPMSPRSLLTCLQEANLHLDRLARGYGRTTEAQVRARGVLASLLDVRVEEIFDEGLHEFLTRVIGDVGRVGAAVHEAYLSGDMR